MNKRDWAARAVGQPATGYFRMALVRHGPLVPCRIQHRRGKWWAEIGTDVYPAHEDPAAAPKVFPIWHGAETISKQDYDALMARVRGGAKGDSLRTPKLAIILKNKPPLF